MAQESSVGRPGDLNERTSTGLHQLYVNSNILTQDRVLHATDILGVAPAEIVPFGQIILLQTQEGNKRGTQTERFL